MDDLEATDGGEIWSIATVPLSVSYLTMYCDPTCPIPTGTNELQPFDPVARYTSVVPLPPGLIWSIATVPSPVLYSKDVLLRPEHQRHDRTRPLIHLPRYTSGAFAARLDLVDRHGAVTRLVLQDRPPVAHLERHHRTPTPHPPTPVHLGGASAARLDLVDRHGAVTRLVLQRCTARCPIRNGMIELRPCVHPPRYTSVVPLPPGLIWSIATVPSPVLYSKMYCSLPIWNGTIELQPCIHPPRYTSVVPLPPGLIWSIATVPSPVLYSKMYGGTRSGGTHNNVQLSSNPPTSLRSTH